MAGSKKTHDKPGSGGARKGAGRPSKADERGLANALNQGYRKVLKSLPEEQQKKFKDEKGFSKGSDVVIQTMIEISLGVHSLGNVDENGNPINAELASQDLKKRFEATKEIQKLFFGPSPEGIVGTAQNKLEIADIAELVSFGPSEEKVLVVVDDVCPCDGDCQCKVDTDESI